MKPLIQQVCVGVSISVAVRTVQSPTSPATKGVHPVTVKVLVAPAPVNVPVIPDCSTRLLMRVTRKLFPDTDERFTKEWKSQTQAGIAVRPSGSDT